MASRRPAKPLSGVPEASGSPAASVHPIRPLTTKKDRIIHAFRNGNRDIRELAYLIGTRPSYVARVLQQAGQDIGYFDLYTPTAIEANVYSQAFRGALSFKTVAAAEASVRRIDELYRHYSKMNDRAGQHHAMVVALIGLNRARWSGKTGSARVFREWLIQNSL